MLLQALADYYEICAADQTSNIPKRGRGQAKISYAVVLSGTGVFLDLVCLKYKTGEREVTQSMEVPEPVKRSSGINPNYLFDNATYVFGLDCKGKPEQSVKSFIAFKQLHHKLLDGCALPEAKALLAFLDHWDVALAATHPLLEPCMTDLRKGANLVFRIDGQQTYLHEYPVLAKKWPLPAQSQNEPSLPCLVTGHACVPVRLHPAIKGVKGGQSMGCQMISFNAKAYESYGHEDDQGRNAPVSEQAAFAYGTALNALLADSAHRFFLGDMTMVFWAIAENYQTAVVCQDLLAMLIDPDTIPTDQIKTDRLRDETAVHLVKGIFSAIAAGKNPAMGFERISPDISVYVLGLSPNAARLSVRLFEQNSLGGFVQKTAKHHQDLLLEPQFENDRQNFSVYTLLRETVSSKAKNKTPSPLLSGAVMRAILEGSPYPVQLLQSILIRIRAEHRVNHRKCAIIKAYLIRCPHAGQYKEVLTVSLNEDSNNVPYTLGRLFALLEKAQVDATSASTTIRDRYFSAAAATPGNVFPTLLRLSTYHTSKSDYGYVIEKKIAGVLEKLNVNDPPFPKQLNIEEQGLFILGYYHQRNALYRKKEEQ